MTDRCRSPRCQAPVIFVHSATSGRPVILDADPILTGHLVVLLPNPKPGVVYGHDDRHSHDGVALEPHDHGPGTQRVVVVPTRLHHHHGPTCEPPRKAVVVRAVYRDHHATCPDAGAWRGRTRHDPPPPQATLDEVHVHDRATLEAAADPSARAQVLEAMSQDDDA